MKVRYARVSTADQKLEPQLDELNQYGCEKIFTDVASGAKAKRLGLASLKEQLRSGDIVVVTRLD